MNKTHIDIERFLPQGEMLRGFLEQPFLGKSDLNNILKERGVFVCQNDKSETIPWFANLLISPSEFDKLRESQKTKEDNLKVNTQTIKWDSEETLVESVPDNFDLNSVLDLEFSNFTVKGSPNFIPVDDNPEHLMLDFEVERNDYSKNWSTTKNTFRGSLELKKINDGEDVKLVVTHTANETKYVANKATTGIVKHFKEKEHIADKEEVVKIEFGLFSNSERVEYLLSLSHKIKNDLLRFNDLLDIEFSPIKSTSLPEKIKWLEKQIEDLKLNGKGLQNTFIVKEKNLHDFVYMYHVVAKFSFDYKGLKGNCLISIGFPEFRRSKSLTSELEVNVKSISFNEPLKNITKNQVIKIILSEFDEIKLKSLEEFKSKKTAAQPAN